ncbi:hypothetical protein L3X38_022566 [Prunus dulcis]|uniref:Reverse transcriptase Ty1/copia-type domain-containing protein n=1 Tax=Prunus dulcis TaxID=3755 RepID=A0AAD4Z3N5_PRUDU|nr:hypothetical protein L3X38_022566 [Prunus dulcis]
MKAELEMIEKNNTWELVDRPFDKPVIGVKWVYKVKLNLDGTVQKNKARLVANGYSQKSGINYNETFPPMARLDTIRTLIALAAQKEWSLYQLDVKSAFLNGILKEEVYVEQPQGYVQENKETKVYKLNKALYGLKQAPRAWYDEIDAYLNNAGFKKSSSEATLYVKTNDTAAPATAGPETGPDRSASTSRSSLGRFPRRKPRTPAASSTGSNRGLLAVAPPPPPPKLGD